MNHRGTITLETERLILRRIELRDSENMFNNWASNPNVTKHMPWSPHSSVEDTKKIISDWVNNYKNINYYQWAIELKEINEVIGTISVVHIKEYISECEIGYCIGEKWWNKGITTEALKQVIHFLFTCVCANRICACHDIDNPSSGKVMIKANMKFEGILRQTGITSTGKICDLAYYSILKSEYKKIRGV